MDPSAPRESSGPQGAWGCIVGHVTIEIVGLKVLWGRVDGHVAPIMPPRGPRSLYPPLFLAYVSDLWRTFCDCMRLLNFGSWQH